MSYSDTGETSHFKTKHIEPVINVEGTTSSGDNSQNDDNQTLFTAAAQKADKHTQKKKEERTITRIFVIKPREFFLFRRIS